MSGPGDEFEDFLARRRTLFRRADEDVLEPPEEVDRLVLHQAREAIRGDRPQRMFGMPGWTAPLAIAATLLVALALVLRTQMPQTAAPAASSPVRAVSQQLDYPPAAAPVTSDPAPAPAEPSNAVTVELAPAAGSPDAAVRPEAEWRGDTRSWLAKIEELRASGKLAEADAEMAEFQRQHRAFAGSPQ
jgi:hypothetical protein